MIMRLPGWVLLYAWILAFMAGIINVVGFMSFEHQGITHLTGTTTMLGSAIADADVTSIVHLLCIIGSFFLGAVVSGTIIGDSTLRLGRRYGVALLIEAIALVLAVHFLDQQSPFGIYLAGAACGLQNAMASTFSGTVIRTSHVTGMFTDLGIFLGHYMRGLAIERRRLGLCLVVITGFFIGGIVGAYGFKLWHYSVLYLPAAIATAMAVFYGYYRRNYPPMA